MATLMDVMGAMLQNMGFRIGNTREPARSASVSRWPRRKRANRGWTASRRERRSSSLPISKQRRKRGPWMRVMTSLPRPSRLHQIWKTSLATWQFLLPTMMVVKGALATVSQVELLSRFRTRTWRMRLRLMTLGHTLVKVWNLQAVQHHLQWTLGACM